MRVRQVIARPPFQLPTLTPDGTVQRAAQLLAKHGTDALLVMEGERPIGIVTPRDALRSLLRHGMEHTATLAVSHTMTAGLITADPDDDLQDSLNTMLQADIRYLPVVRGGRLIGVLKLNDLVQHQLSAQQEEIRFLSDYIADLQGAIPD